MNGSNSLAESDDTPLEPCPICLRKLQLATGIDPAVHRAETATMLRARRLE